MQRREQRAPRLVVDERVGARVFVAARGCTADRRAQEHDQRVDEIGLDTIGERGVLFDALTQRRALEQAGAEEVVERRAHLRKTTADPACREAAHDGGAVLLERDLGEPTREAALAESRLAADPTELGGAVAQRLVERLTRALLLVATPDESTRAAILTEPTHAERRRRLGGAQRDRALDGTDAGRVARLVHRVGRQRANGQRRHVVLLHELGRRSRVGHVLQDELELGAHGGGRRRTVLTALGEQLIDEP